MAPSRNKTHWQCHGKDSKGQPCEYMVPMGKEMCMVCGHEPPEHISGTGGGKPSATGGKGNGRKAAGSERAAD